MVATALPLPVLMLVTDRKAAGGEAALVRKVAEAVESGANVVQLREKDLGRRSLVALGRELARVVTRRALLISNGARGDATEMGADGVHLPEAMPLARQSGLIVGRSVHSVEAAMRAEGEGVDYILAGPVFATASHPDLQPAGVQLISNISSVVSVPVIGIGGITAANAMEVMAAGARGVAVIGAILLATDVRAATAALRDALDAACR